MKTEPVRGWACPTYARSSKAGNSIVILSGETAFYVNDLPVLVIPLTEESIEAMHGKALRAGCYHNTSIEDNDIYAILAAIGITEEAPTE